MSARGVSIITVRVGTACDGRFNEIVNALRMTERAVCKLDHVYELIASKYKRASSLNGKRTERRMLCRCQNVVASYAFCGTVTLP